MKKILLPLALAGTILLTSCGSGMKAADRAESNSSAHQFDNAAEYKSDDSYADSEAYENGESSSMSYKQSEVKAINTQMLVYSCDMSIDVLEFDEAVDKIHELISTYNGFIESENYNDGGNTSKWEYSDSEKWKNLYATIRIPSADYEDFCEAAEKIGDMRRKSSSVQNLTTEYSDLSTTLSIYEAKEKRYLDILSEIKNEQEAIEVENELTTIQIEIAKIKTRMNNIENDVAYSFINLTLNEVRKYSDKPVIERNDTFGQRLKNTLSKTWDEFLYFLENLLFILIRILPYILIIGIITFIIVKLVKFFSKRSEKRKKEKYQQKIQQAPPMPINGPVPPNPQMIPPNMPAPPPVNAPAPHADTPPVPPENSEKSSNNKENNSSNK
jgi:peroxiredoxin family protein